MKPVKPSSIVVNWNVGIADPAYSWRNRPTFQHACRCMAARDSIMKSWADHHIKDELDAVSGDISAIWRTAQ